ncbi:ras-related protein ORAB-1-like [Uloborus diversus]|uniref:ras-related protein ORAB-1-like n=1 Tax=Uloborus diversus TaxID=327109 RepID=UPI00240991A1|nr:ras-related protein ORAB-1-like [Uloborus diversus]
MARNVNHNKTANYSYKILLLGDYNVGKSSIYCRFKDNQFKEVSKLTVGADNFGKVYELEEQNVTLVLWDTVGTERFRTLTRNYFRNADACLLVFSYDEPDSLTSLTQWVEDINNFAENALKVLVGNKCDLKSQTTSDKIKAFAHHHDCDIVFIVSAKTGEGIDEMFRTVAQKLSSRNSEVRNNQILFEKDVHQLQSQESKMNCC